MPTHVAENVLQSNLPFRGAPNPPHGNAGSRPMRNPDPQQASPQNRTNRPLPSRPDEGSRAPPDDYGEVFDSYYDENDSRLSAQQQRGYDEEMPNFEAVPNGRSGIGPWPSYRWRSPSWSEPLNFQCSKTAKSGSRTVKWR